MDLIGKRVKHNKFGEGTITQQDTSYVTVKFMTEAAPKRFQYPSCFQTFLKLLDVEAAAQTNETVKQHEEDERKKKQKAAEEVEARYFAKRMQENSSKSGKTIELRAFTSVAEFCYEYKKAVTS